MTNTSDRTVANVEGGPTPQAWARKHQDKYREGGPPPRLGQKLCTDYCATQLPECM